LPVSDVTVVCGWINAGPVAVTVTPGNTAPCASMTRPWMVPVLLAPPPCANAEALNDSAISNANQRLMFSSSWGSTPSEQNER
jgi:hypothetical protein